MKRIYISLLSVFALLLIAAGCEDYLDKSPDMGLSETDVYRDYASIRGFLDQTYNWLENVHEYGRHQNGRTHPGSISDEFASMYNSADVITMNSGNWLMDSGNTFEIGVTGNTMISYSYQAIRVANRVINNIDKVPLNEEQRNQILGQAHFMRAWYYFQLLKRYGGMPIFDKVFVGDGDEDIPRKTYHESHDWMMEDIEKAIAMLPDKWDDDNTGRATKIAAMALKSVTQLYDASPLMQNGLSSIQIKGYDKERAAKAAKSASDVLKYIDDNSSLGYRLMTGNEYKNIFYWPAPPYTQPEYIWYNWARASNFSRYIRSFWLPAEYAKGTGNDATVFNAPTQNMVDLYEKKGEDGIYYPIDNPKAGYNLQELFKNRDPRFYNNIIIPGQKWGVNKQNKPQYITTYVGGDIANNLLTNRFSNRRQQTSYLCKKFIWEGADQWQERYEDNRVITVYIRVTQIYLDLAEASFEATGSPTEKVDGSKYSALEALNIVRNRVGVTDIPPEIVADKDKFRDAIRRERAVELMFENQRWWDIRRWMIMHEIFAQPYPLKGLRATPKNPNHNKVSDKSTLEFDYEVVDLIPEIRGYRMRNYWYPFPLDDANSLINLVQNPGW